MQAKWFVYLFVMKGFRLLLEFQKRDRHHIRIFLYVLTVFSLFLSVVFGNFYSFEGELSLKALSDWSAILALGILVGAYFIMPTFSFSFLFLFTLWVFHFPTHFFLSHFDIILPFNTKLIYWFVSIQYALSCFSSCMLGNLVSFGTTKLMYLKFSEDKFKYFLALAFVLLVFLILVRNIMAMPDLSYANALKGENRIGTIAYSVSLLLSIAMVYGSNFGAKLAIVFEVLFASFLFLLGMRGPALYPLLAFSIPMTIRFPSLKKLLLIGFAICIFILIPFVRSARVGSGSSIVPSFDAFVELGLSLTTVARTIEKIEDQKLCYQYGKTYFFPFLRRFWSILGEDNAEVLHLGSFPTFKNDLRYFGNTLDTSAGGSMIGESYYNFGYCGFFIFFIFGYFIAYLDRMPSNQLKLCIAVAVFYPFLMYTRDHFWSLPHLTLFRLFIVIAVVACANSLKKVPKYLGGVKTI